MAYGIYVIGASLREPHHMESTVKFVFLLAYLLDTSSIYMAESHLSATSNTWSANHGMYIPLKC